jgi:LysM repeat protein
MMRKTIRKFPWCLLLVCASIFSLLVACSTPDEADPTSVPTATGIPTVLSSTVTAPPTPTPAVTQKPEITPTDPVSVDPSWTATPTVSEIPRSGVITYTVQSGDTVAAIAERFDLRPETIVFANQASLSEAAWAIHPGMVLTILPVDGAYHEWEADDTLKAVAERYGVEPAVILDYPGNELGGTGEGEVAIPPGTWIIVPNNRLSMPQAWLEPPPPAPSAPDFYPTPNPDWNANFDLGGYIRSLDHAAEMKFAGMTWVKRRIAYATDAGEVIAEAHDAGFKIQLTAIGGPDLVTEKGFLDDYSGWVAEIAAAGADAIEVWSEPNIDRSWARGAISPKAYTELLCGAYDAIKDANSETLVISAAPAPTGYFDGCSAQGCDDLPFLEGLAKESAIACMDYVGAHHAAGATSPAARSGHPADPDNTHHSWFFLPQTELYYEIFGGERQLFYTALGYASQEGVPRFSEHFAWAQETDNAEQALWLAEAVRLGRDTGMVHAIMIWNVDFPRYGPDPQDGYALIRPGGRCPACATLRDAVYPEASAPGSGSETP